MKRMKHLGVIGALGALLVAGLLVSPAAATSTFPHTAGDWFFRPKQASTSTVVTTTGSSYKSAVRPPINADGSSNWPAKRGVIPVQFDLLAAPTTTTTTTTTYDPPVWQSLQNGPQTFAFAQLCLVDGLYSTLACPSAPTTPALNFSDIQNLRADYVFTTGDCHAGSLRWDVYVQHGANIETVEVYYGNPNGVPVPPGQSCSGTSSETGKNLMDNSDLTLPVNRFEMLGGWGVPGPVYTTYADAFASTNAGTDKVVAVQLTLDSGFAGDQKANVSNVIVNDNLWVPLTTETSSTTTTGDYAKTCILPAAGLRWAKNDATPTGAVNEAESIQPKDTGQLYRQVDCKYIYNLDVSSLNGQGTYTVWVNINGVNIQVPATFDLK
jgi:hypothetical protein